MQIFRFGHPGSSKKLMILGVLIFTLGFATLALTQPSPSPKAGAESATGSTRKLSQVDAKRMLREFQKAQRNALRGLEHRSRMEVKELQASQRARQKEWESKEKDARHQFFAEHKKGAERRAYVKDFLDRRKAMLQIFSDERTRRKNDLEVRLQSFKTELAQKLKDFQDYLLRYETPPSELWPR